MENTVKKLFSLNERVIVVTGALGLLGEKHVEAIAAFGGNPVLIDLSQSKLDKLSKKLNTKYKSKSIGIALDITNEKEVESVSNKIFNIYGKIDGLVNNAANNPRIESSTKKNFSRLENFKLDQWQQDIAVGLTGAYLCSKHFGQKIVNNDNGGSIVNISSDLGLIAPDQRLYEEKNVSNDKQNVKPVTYSVVKSGLIGLTRYLSTYWTDKNIRCNVICPGGVLNKQNEYFLNKVCARIPMNRLAQPDEYQGTLIWMLSDASSYLNGAIVSVDGGRTSW